MADYNDKRLNQDRNEQEKKSNASVGMWIAALVILLGIIAAIYTYSVPTVTTTQETTTTTGTQPAGATSTTPATSATPAGTTTPGTTTQPSTTTTPTY